MMRSISLIWDKFSDADFFENLLLEWAIGAANMMLALFEHKKERIINSPIR